MAQDLFHVNGGHGISGEIRRYPELYEASWNACVHNEQRERVMRALPEIWGCLHKLRTKAEFSRRRQAVRSYSACGNYAYLCAI